MNYLKIPDSYDSKTTENQTPPCHILPIVLSAILLNERTCLICNSGEVGLEDENHFLFDCAHYVDETEILLHDIGDNFGDMNVDEKLRVIFEHPLGNYWPESWKV